MDGEDTSNLRSSKPKFNLPLGGLATSKDKSDGSINLLAKNSGRKGESSITPSNV